MALTKTHFRILQTYENQLLLGARINGGRALFFHAQISLVVPEELLESTLTTYSLHV